MQFNASQNCNFIWPTLVRTYGFESSFTKSGLPFSHKMLDDRFALSEPRMAVDAQPNRCVIWFTIKMALNFRKPNLQILWECIWNGRSMAWNSLEFISNAFGACQLCIWFFVKIMEMFCDMEMHNYRLVFTWHSNPTNCFLRWDSKRSAQNCSMSSSMLF